MIAWTVTAPFSEASHSYTCSESNSRTGTEGFYFNPNEGSMNASGSGSASINSGVDGSGLTTFEQTIYDEGYQSIQITNAANESFFIAVSAKQEKTIKRSSSIDFGSTTSVIGTNYLSYWDDWNVGVFEGDATSTEYSTNLGAETAFTYPATTISNQTTSIASVAMVKTATTTGTTSNGTTVASALSVVNGAVQTVNGTFVRTTTQSTTRLATAMGSSTSTVVTSSSFDGGKVLQRAIIPPFTALSPVTSAIPHNKITNYIAQGDEEIWSMTTTSAQLADLSQIANKLSSSGTIEPKSELATVLATTLPLVIVDGELSQLAASWQTETYTTTQHIWQSYTASRLTWSLASNSEWQNAYGLPANTTTAKQTRHRQTTTTAETLFSTFVSGFSQSVVDFTTKSIRAMADGASYEDAYTTTTTVSAAIPVVVIQSSSYAGVRVNGEIYWTIENGAIVTTAGDDIDTNMSETRSFTEGVTSNSIKTHRIGLLQGNNISINETSYINGWTAPSAFSNAALLISAENMPFPISPYPSPALLSVRPRINVPFVSSSSLNNSNGWTTYSAGVNGVTKLTKGTAAAAEIQSSSGSWATIGEALTSQDAEPWPAYQNGPQTPFRTKTQIINANKLSRYGGVPAIGSAGQAIVAPGNYWTAKGSATGTLDISTASTFSGTEQTAAMFLPKVFCTESGGALFSVVHAAPHDTNEFFK